MKATDLMIGDWILYGGKPVRVLQLSEGMDYKQISPIPITAEILEKNGFEKCNEDSDGAIQYEFGDELLGVDVWVNSKPCLFGCWRTWPDAACSYSAVEELPINYVHELQHALNLCGIEKEIVLW